MRNVPLLLALTLAAGAVIPACAPRMNKTHFARWAEQDQKRREEAAAEEKVEAWMRQQASFGSPEDAKGSDKAPASTPRTTNGQTGTHADTPPITRTSTRSSRVIKPSDQNTEQEDEALY